MLRARGKERLGLTEDEAVARWQRICIFGSVGGVVAQLRGRGYRRLRPWRRCDGRLCTENLRPGRTA